MNTRNLSCLLSVPLARLTVALLAASSLHAGELKVDINRDSKNYDNATETGYVKWSPDTTNGAATGTAAISGSFTTASGESVTVTFAQTAASASAGGTGLLSNWYQTGAQGTAKLVSDGITVAPSNLATGGQILMTITGLNAGTHTLLTYHNAWDALTAGSLGPIDISVNGTQIVDNLQTSIRAATNAAATSSYVGFSVSGPGATTQILFAADPTAGSGGVTVRNVIINGFEIDTPNANRIAYNPSPADADEHVNADSGSVTASWSPALSGDTVAHRVYLGTDYTTVKNAGVTSSAYRGQQTGASTTLPAANPNGTYYWRIDEVDSLGNVTAGPVWSFRPRMLAFPGAEGHGRFARGGRGGKVVHVTSLADYTTGQTPVPGTLRHAVEVETAPRVIVFDVGGMITLLQRLTLSDDHVTVAGQTAPGKGICLREWPLGLSGSDDSVIRFIRNRPGNLSGQTIDGGGLAGCNHAIMDHCSISWSIDEAFSSRSAKNITLQATLISEALNIAGHQNYPPGTAHGYAATIGGDKGSFHHNLLAHCEGRNWSMGGGLDSAGNFAGRLDIRNNVVYNWRTRTTDGGAHEVNFVNNYYKPGAATTLFTALNPTYDNYPGTQQYYMSGNVMPGRFDESNQAAGRTVAGSNGGSVPTSYPVWVDTPFFDSQVTTQSALDAYKRVLSDVGANQPVLDDHDARVILETRNGTYTYTGTGLFGGYPGLPNSQDDVGGWESYPTTTRAANWDSDADGLPDWWETIAGTNLNSPAGDYSDANADPDNNGYTRLDDYLAWIARPHLQAASGGYVDLDLAPLTTGYTDSPIHQVQLAASSASAGTVTVLADGHTARFTAAANFTGLAVFTHTVIDAAGYELSGDVGVLVSAVPTPAIAVNSGGGASGTYAADGSYSGGSSYTSTATIDTSAVTSPAPQSVYQSERNGNFTYTFNGLVPGAGYLVRLHFAEIFWNISGARTFNVMINGSQVLSAFDIYAAAGAKNKAVIKEFTIPASSAGQIAIQYATILNSAKSSGVQVIPILAMNSGGGASGAYAADGSYSGGSSYAITATIDTSAVANPAPQSVYQSERYGNFTYTYGGLVAGATYRIRLHFAEVFWSASGKRTFNVAINGSQVLSAFDIYAAAGAKNKAVVREFTATASSGGQIAIQYASVVDSAKSSGIELIKQ